jgi:hypothetical protein
MMIDDHWFDRLNRVIVRRAPRREVARVAGALLAGMLLSGAPVTTTASRQKPKPKPRCGVAACAAQWPDDPENRNECELKCGRCRIRKKFCIRILFPNDPEPLKVATCCHEHQTCCGNKCVDTKTDDQNCGGCGNPCAAGESCVDGACRTTSEECRDADCPVGQRCVWNGADVACGCGEGFKYCVESTRCIREEYVCCGGNPTVTGYCFPGLICCGNVAGTTVCVHPGNPC